MGLNRHWPPDPHRDVQHVLIPSRVDLLPESRPTGRPQRPVVSATSTNVIRHNLMSVGAAPCRAPSSSPSASGLLDAGKQNTSSTPLSRGVQHAGSGGASRIRQSPSCSPRLAGCHASACARFNVRRPLPCPPCFPAAHVYSGFDACIQWIAHRPIAEPGKGPRPVAVAVRTSSFIYLGVNAEWASSSVFIASISRLHTIASSSP